MLRWIDELNGIVYADEQAREIKKEIRRIRKEENCVQNKRKIEKLYELLDEIQFKPDYLCLVIDRNSDYRRACKGFTINEIKYVRLLATSGGVKNNTIVFVSERLAPELRRRIENDRNPNVSLVTAKLEAYKALTCSASIPVSMPHGVLVVKDCETVFRDDVLYLSDSDNDEPSLEFRENEEIKLNASDGCGIMLPSLAERWSRELRLKYVMSGANTRCSFEKGMVYTFDFLDFADKIANGAYLVKDAWGKQVDIRSVELILTTSMLKLWDSYESCDDYLSKSYKNGYTFAITKTCPRKLESSRTINYQYIQPYDLSDEQIEELIRPTMNEIRDVLGGDWRKTVLFLRGGHLNPETIGYTENDIAKAIMINPQMMNDPYVQSTIYKAIKNRINEAKVGVLRVHGNYSIASGDPYALCQSIFGLRVTGLLKAGEIYNQYWADVGASNLVCFRSPMSVRSNIRKVTSANSEEIRYWYRYMNTCTIFNAWDTAMIALNGMDFDGDLVMLTDNPVLLSNHKEEPALMCEQKRAEKKISTEEDFIKANISSFGNEIGAITNRITSMYEVQAGFIKGSKEYDILEYRIRCGQKQQQDAIDKIKGISCKPMPHFWFDKRSPCNTSNEEEVKLYRSITADKKPYFMRYIYPKLSKQYDRYISNTNRNAIRDFDLTVAEIEERPVKELSPEQKLFLERFYKYMPVGLNDCVMNKICRRFEEEFDNHVKRHNETHAFDYTIMKSSKNYTQRQRQAIQRLYTAYTQRLQNHKIMTSYERFDKYDSLKARYAIEDDFRERCDKICPNEDALCNIILDICYTRFRTKQFVWDMCSEAIIAHLLDSASNIICVPVPSDVGEIEYGGETFTLELTEWEMDSDDST